jgi:hypothetical protein
MPITGNIRSYIATIDTANTNRDGTGTLVNLVTGATNGTIIEQISIQATGTTTAGMARFFLYDGTTNALIHEVVVQAVTPSAFVPTFGATIRLPNVRLSPTHILKASTHNAEEFRIVAYVTEL